MEYSRPDGRRERNESRFALNHSATPMTSQTAVFTQLVRDHMRAAPVRVPIGTPAGEAVARLTQAKASGLVVIAPQGAIAGIVTEQDVSRRIAFRLNESTPVESVMTAPVTVIRDDDYLYHAIGMMRRRQLRHMPVVDGSGRAVGILELHDALAVAAEQMVGQIDRLTHDESIEGLGAVKAEQVAVAEQLFADNVPAPDILGLISHVNCDLYRRAVDLALRDMNAAGEAPPPVPFAVIVMGSGGRGESSFTADQDNGFVIADYPDARHDAVDGAFRRLAERMTALLDRVGLPLCRGGVMATNPLWRKTVSQWRAQMDYWTRHRDEGIVRLGDIFFDFRPVYGDLSLAAKLRGYVTERIGTPAFLQAMYAVQADHHTATGLFGRLRGDTRGPHRGQINLKYRASLPLVETIRLLALRERIAETGTLARIDALADAGVLDGDEREDLSRAFALITRLTLRRQIEDFKAGRPVDYWVRARELSSRERRQLTESLDAVEDLRGRVRTDFSGALF